MNDQEINKKAEEVLASFDGSARAEPKPFLLTRINARLQQVPDSAWTKAFVFLSTPLVAGFGIALFLIVNVIIIFQNKNDAAAGIALQNTNAAQYEFAINVSSIYDVENQ